MLRLKLLDRLMLAEVVPVFFGSVAAFTILIWIISSADLFRYLTRGVPLWIIAQLVSLNLPPWLVATFPMAMLLATILAFFNLSTKSEAVVLLAVGIPFRRLIVPILMFGVLVTAIGVYVNDTVVPAANKQFGVLKENATHELIETTAPFSLPPLRDADKNLQATAWVEGGYDATAQALRRVTLVEYDPKSNLPVATIFAKTAKWAGGSNWRLYDVTIQRAGTLLTAPQLTTRDIHETPQDVSFIEAGPDTLNFRQLAQRIRQLKAAGDGNQEIVREAEVDLWGKIALPCSSLFMAFVGAPLGMRPQRGANVGLAVGMGLGVILVYYALFNFMKVLGESGHADPLVAAWLPNLICLIAGGFLTWRATT